MTNKDYFETARESFGLDAHQISINGRVYHSKSINAVDALQKLIPAILGLLKTDKNNKLKIHYNMILNLYYLYQTNGVWTKYLDAEESIEEQNADAEKTKLVNMFMDLFTNFNLSDFIIDNCKAENYNDDEFEQIDASNPREYVKKCLAKVELKIATFCQNVLKSTYFIDEMGNAIYLRNIAVIYNELETDEIIYGLCWEVLKHNFGFMVDVINNLTVEFKYKTDAQKKTTKQ